VGYSETNLEMGGAAQNISIADIVAFEWLWYDDEAVEARKVKKAEVEDFRKRVLSKSDQSALWCLAKPSMV